MSNREDEIEQALLRLYELGLVELHYDENLEASFSIKDPEKLKRFVETMRDNQKDV